MSANGSGNGYDFDLIVLGAGPGGVRAARQAAERKARVAIVEQGRIGGVCVTRGCVPKKVLMFGSHFAESFRDAARYGWTMRTPPSFDWHALIAAKNAASEKSSSSYQNILDRAGVRFLPGRGRLRDAQTVEVDGKPYTAKRILVATGARPRLPDLPGIEHAITSDQALDLMTLPRRIVIVGGGFIGIEFATLFHNLGLDVTLLVRGHCLLRGLDTDMREAATSLLLLKGIDIRTRTGVHSIEKKATGYRVHMIGGRSMETDLVLFATGRRPNVENLGLETAGVALDSDGTIKVDERYQTNVPSIFAIGDVVGRLPRTPVALAEANVFVRAVWDGVASVVDYDLVPSGIFSQPPIAWVGLSEEKARNRGFAVEVYRHHFRPMYNVVAEREEEAHMKLIVDANTGHVLGCFMIGTQAPEIMQGMAIALTGKITKEQIDATLGIHPTVAEEFVTMCPQSGDGLP